jgi:hypothetical protein
VNATEGPMAPKRTVPTMRFVRRLLTALCVALAVSAVAAAAGNPVVAATKRTATAKSITFEMVTTTAIGGQKTTLTGSGAQSGTSFKMTMRTRAQGVTFRFDAILLREGGRYVMYMRSPAFQAQLPPGKTWVRLALSKQTANLGIDLASLLTASQSYLPLERALVSTTRVGREVVAGVSTTRYRVVVDVKRAARALPAFGQQVAAVERATGTRLGRIPYDVWVGEGRLRRVRFSMPAVVSGVSGRAVQTVTFVSYDRPVRITAPPRGQVFTP